MATGEGSVGFILTAKVADARKSLKALDKDLTDVNYNLNTVGTAVKKAFNSVPIIGFTKALKELFTVMIKASEAEASYIESTNLLQVAFHKVVGETNELYDKTDNLINTMSRLYGLDPAKLTQQAGIYKQMTSAMGFANKESALLTNNLLRLQQDTASLYNLTSEQVASKFQSALAGQTRAVRSLGVDITQATLQQKLYNMGIKASVTELDRASKTALIYITMQDQLSNANGDAKRTINQVAQQTKQFRDQLDIASRQIGAVFIPILKAILPIANAILMVFNDIMEMILGVLGVDVKNMAQESGLPEYNQYWDENEEKVNASYEATKKLLGLRGFDKLNNITTPTKSGGTGGTGGTSKYYNDLMNHIKEYNEGLEDTLNRARQIADAIESWLIYTDKDGNKRLTILGELLVGFVTALTGIKFLKAILAIKDFFGMLTGAKTASGLGKLVTGNPAGLAGLSLSLSTIATLASIAIIAYVVASTWADIKKLKAEMKSIREESAKARKDWLKDEKDLNKIYDTQRINRQNALSLTKQAQEPLKKLLGLSKDMLETAKQTVKNSENDLETMKKRTSEIKLNKDEAQKYLDNLIEQYNYNNEIIRQLELQGEDCTELRKINGEYYKEIGKVADKWKLVDGNIDDVIYSTSQANTNTKNTYKNLQDINNYKFATKTMTINITANTTKLDEKLSTSATKMINNIDKALDERNKKTGLPTLNSPAKNAPKLGTKAEGGFLNQGEVFIAREAGAEMVGSINGRTAVANNDQIVKGITNGVMAGVAKAMQGAGGSSKVVIEATGDTSGLMNFITFKQKEQSRQYGL